MGENWTLLRCWPRGNNCNLLGPHTRSHQPFPPHRRVSRFKEEYKELKLQLERYKNLGNERVSVAIYLRSRLG
jgi:hypothetical protein